jgi:predicted deacetylase
VLHDVAPVTWPACEKLLRAVDAVGPVPVTLLVVPEYHHGKPIDLCPGFVRAVEARLARGDEVAMHGCFHWDDLPVTSPSEWWRRRFYTAGEGEFAALGRRSAHARLARGVETFLRVGWPVRGFVAPAWLLSAGTCAALSGFPFAYTSTRRRIYSLPDWRQHGTASLIWSVGSAPRRWAFGMLNRWQLHRKRDASLLRLGIHPVDGAYPDVVRFWTHALEEVLAFRKPMTKAAWLGVEGAAGLA